LSLCNSKKTFLKISKLKTPLNTLPVNTGLGARAAVLELPAISPPSINGTALDGPGAESLATLKKIETYELLQK
jgi:hypothetical protein